MDRLLTLLEENGRSDPEELADVLDLSADEVREKIREYESEGIIQGYKAVINREKLPEKDSPVTALIEVRISPQPDTGFESVAQSIYGHPEVKACYLCSGDYDLLIRVEGDDLQQIAQFVATELAALETVQGTVSHFLLKTYKEDGIRFDEPTPDHRLSISL